MADDPTITFQDDFDLATDYFRTGRYKPQQGGALVWGDGETIASGDVGPSYLGVGALYTHAPSGKGLLASAPTALPAVMLGPPEVVGDPIPPGSQRYSELLLTAVDMQSLVPSDMTAIELNLTAEKVRLWKAAVNSDGSRAEFDFDGGWNMAYGFFSDAATPDTEQRGIYVGFSPEDSGEHFVTGAVDFVADTVEAMMFASVNQFDSIVDDITDPAFPGEFDGQLFFGLMAHSDYDGFLQPSNSPRWPPNTAFNLGDFAQKILLVPRGDPANTVDYQQTFTYGTATFVKTGVLNADFRGKLIGIAIKTDYQESGVISGWGYKVWTTPGVPTITPTGTTTAPPPSIVVPGPGESGSLRRYADSLTGVQG